MKGMTSVKETLGVRVNVDNFKRAESDSYFSKFTRDGMIGQFSHKRGPAPIEKQDVIRMNRDTLYSSAVVDLDASPAIVTLPNAGKRYMALQVINEDHYTITVEYNAGSYRFTRDRVGTRYVLFLVRTFFNPADPSDIKEVHTLQDELKIEQAYSGKFEVALWEHQVSGRDAKRVECAGCGQWRFGFCTNVREPGSSRSSTTSVGHCRGLGW
jgi:hypothetical protein